MQIGISGAGGFIGGHLVDFYVSQGHVVQAYDKKPQREWFSINPKAKSYVRDMSKKMQAYEAVSGCDWFFNLAADMGGMGFIETHKAECMLSVLSSTFPLLAARDYKIDRFFYSSSACVYAADKQTASDIVALRESDAYPAEAEDGYGWEKLFTERMCRHFREDYDLETRIARFHNVYGPRTSYDGGREKAPAAICRKVIQSQLDNTQAIEIWGDGEQTRSFMYIDDCIAGIDKIMSSDFYDPLNLGSSELVSINQLVTLVEEIAGVSLVRNYDLTAPLGVRGRNSDNTLIQHVLDWEPSTTLRDGMKKTFDWVYSEMTK